MRIKDHLPKLQSHMLFALAGITTKIQTGADVILWGEESGGQGGGEQVCKLLMIGVIWQTDRLSFVQRSWLIVAVCL